MELMVVHQATLVQEPMLEREVVRPNIKSATLVLMPKKSHFGMISHACLVKRQSLLILRSSPRSHFTFSRSSLRRLLRRHEKMRSL